MPIPSQKTEHKLRSGTAECYTLIPQSLTQTELRDSALYWRIEIMNLPGKPVLGVDLIGDMIIGRGCQADLDLDHYSAYLEGVSREHVIIRPADNQLTIMDLGSTNGTYVDGQQLKSSVTTTLNDGSSIGLGNMSFEVKIVDHTTLGSLRESLVSEAEDKIKSGVFSKKKLLELFAAKESPQPSPEEDNTETLIMHFRKMMKHPNMMSRWMNNNRKTS